MEAEESVVVGREEVEQEEVAWVVVVWVVVGLAVVGVGLEVEAANLVAAEAQ